MPHLKFVCLFRIERNAAAETPLLVVYAGRQWKNQKHGIWRPIIYPRKPAPEMAMHKVIIAHCKIAAGFRAPDYWFALYFLNGHADHKMAILYHYAGGPDIRDMAHIQGEKQIDPGVFPCCQVKIVFGRYCIIYDCGHV
jgi:hypothetical protein